MSFYEIETGLSTILHGVEMRKEDRANMALRLKAKLAELRACGVDMALMEDDEEDQEIVPAPARAPKAAIAV